jgi:hypothetical protein
MAGKSIDLRRFFETVGWARTYNRRQEYNLLITIDGTSVRVEPMDIVGWIDGGYIVGR